MIPRPPRRHAREHAGIVTVLAVVATLLAVVTSLTALVLADLFPPDGRSRILPARGVALATAWTCLLLAMHWGLLRHRPAPLLVHVRIGDEATAPDESMRERHLGLLKHARRRGMALKSVTRWADLAPGTERDPLDLVAGCAQTAAAVEAVINLDATSNRLVLACDMPWPAALAVGAQLPATADVQLLELTGGPRGTGVAAPEAVFPLPRKPARSLDSLVVEQSALIDRSEGRRVGLVLALTQPPDRTDLQVIFAQLGITEYSLVQPAGVAGTGNAGPPHRFTGRDLSSLARRLPAMIASVKQRCGDRELVIVAAVPSSLALAVGWALAQNPQPFFSGTHLLQYDARTRSYRPVRVHPAQPADPPFRPAGGSRAVPAPPARSAPRAARGLNLTTVYLAEPDTSFAANTLIAGTPFDVVGAVAIGKDRVGDVTEEKLSVSVVNLSASSVLLKGETTIHPSQDGDRLHNSYLRVSFAGGWDAEDGDVLEAVATYRLRAGEEIAYSAARSRWVVVEASEQRPRALARGSAQPSPSTLH